MRRYGFTLFTFILILAGCTRASSGRSKLVLQFGRAGSGALEAFPAGRTLCFALNVTGAGIPSEGGTCRPGIGLAAGFVPTNGGTVELSVPKGTGRILDLYVYVAAASVTSCPSLTEGFAPAKEASVFKAASETRDLLADTVDITMTAIYPGAQKNLLAQMPATCRASVAQPVSGVEAVAGGGRMAGTAYQIQSRFSFGGDSAGMMGSQYQIRSIGMK